MYIYIYIHVYIYIYVYLVEDDDLQLALRQRDLGRTEGIINKICLNVFICMNIYIYIYIYTLYLKRYHIIKYMYNQTSKCLCMLNKYL